MWFLLISLLVPMVWTNPIPVSELEEAVDVLLTSVEAHGRKIKTLQDEMYNVGDVLEQHVFLLKQLKEIVEDKKDPGYADEIGAEEVKDTKVEERVLNDELQKIRGLKPEDSEEEEEEHPAEVEETEVEETKVEEMEVENESEESAETLEQEPEISEKSAETEEKQSESVEE
ncbi:uncharacterized protein LOC128166299 [Crassostrea angulata]|uniref:uncharacterized protein LOC128166299 n=1 Tax=Magallana angulata TaxID=2784310 RepID=UPI0022B0B2F7|nr:uncharacterized protein LOC128166299 [Crassostrea angulata]